MPGSVPSPELFGDEREAEEKHHCSESGGEEGGDLRV